MPDSSVPDGSSRDAEWPNRARLHPVLRLQQSIGNRALQRLLSSRGIALQAKLTVCAADDPCELEADRVAEQVVATPAPGSVFASRAPKEEEIREESIVQRAPHDQSGGFEPRADLESGLSTSDGSPLPANTRAFMERRFGTDFSQVRVHAGAKLSS